MKKFFIVLGIVVAVFVGLGFTKDVILKSMVTNMATKIIGTPVHMDGFSLQFFTSTIHITGFKMDNPAGFPEGVLVSCPQIKVIFKRASLFKKTPHFLLVDIELKDMVITKNKEGKLNVDSLKIVQQSKSSPSAPMQIDRLNLSIGKSVYMDYSTSGPPSVRAYNVNSRKSYKSVPSAEQLGLLVLAAPMKAAAIKDAEIYGVAAVAGVAVLPVAIAATFIGQDSVKQDIDATFDHAYQVSLNVVKSMGTIRENDASKGVIKADIHGAMVALRLTKGIANKTEITISARKYMFPQPETAGGVLYQIDDKL